jgi:hypothetical protein
MMPTVLEACAILTADRCLCGQPKKLRRALCLGCSLVLPTAMRNALARHVGNGFEEAYQAAKEWLGAA